MKFLNFKLRNYNLELVKLFLKFATVKKQLKPCKKQLATRNLISNSQKKFATRKIRSQLVKSNLQLVNLFS